LSLNALERTLQEIVRRHEVLRTNYKVDAGQPVQVISSDHALVVNRIDLSGLPVESREQKLRETTLAEARKGFSLERDVMLRAGLIKLGPQDHVLLLTTHHIAADGWSIEVLWKEIAALYGSFVSGRGAALPELPIQYADFALWQRTWLQGEILDSQLAYWRNQLAGAPALLELPLDYPRPAIQTYRGARHSLT